MPCYSTSTMGKAAMVVVALFSACIWRPVEASAAESNPFEHFPAKAVQSHLDELVFRQLDQLGIEPAQLSSDSVFVRRVYLDVLGLLPTAYEAREFILDPKLDKRKLLVDKLLEREEFADYWAWKWSDLLRIKAEFPINLWPHAAQAYHHWVRKWVQENRPYDLFARELLTASGSNFRVPPVNFYRAVQSKDPRTIAQAVALTFMGQRTDTWSKERLSALAVFFEKIGYKATGEWKEEIVFYDPFKTNLVTRDNQGQVGALFPDGTIASLSHDRDPRVIFADWLTSPRNPWFACNVANRIWGWLLGRGIIHEPDDLRPNNSPSNPELLTYLEHELINAHFDLKHLYRLILNSSTYQLASIPKSQRPEAAAHFAFYPLRRLEAEVLIDMLNQITGSSELYSSAIPEPFTFLPANTRAVALPDGSITSTFLDLFGRPPRDTGLENERNNRITAEQRLHLLNSSHMLRKVAESRMIQFQTKGDKNVRQIGIGLYLGILSRLPTESEIQTVENYFQSSQLGLRDAAVDISWALMNTAEFLYRH